MLMVSGFKAKNVKYVGTYLCIKNNLNNCKICKIEFYYKYILFKLYTMKVWGSTSQTNNIKIVNRF